VEERELTVMLMVDLSGSMSFGTASELKRERAAELSALLALSAAQNRDNVGLITFTDRVEQFIPPNKGTRHVLRLIRELLYYQPTGRTTDIASALKYLNLVTHRKAIVFLISDMYGSEFVHDLKLSSRRHDLIVVALRDEREVEVPPVGLVVFNDPETGEQMTVDTSNRTSVDRFAEAISTETTWLENEIAAAGADLLTIGSRDDYVPKLHAFFKRRERSR
jgi:uncharacterized protein (DUF58 family)